MDYRPYKDYELHDIITEPRRIAKDPYKLHAAFMVSCLFDLYEPSDEEEAGSKPFDPEKSWGWLADKSLFDKTMRNARQQFSEACDNGLSIDIWGKNYSIRYASKLDKERLKDIFSFPLVEVRGESYYKITKDGIIDLSDAEECDPISEFKKNKAYLQKVVKTALDDEHDGWNKLTDMEVAMYLWHLFCKKTDCRDYWTFRKTFKNDLYTTEQDERGCWNDKAIKTNRHDTQYLFSARKVQDWNERHHQKSIINLS